MGRNNLNGHKKISNSNQQICQHFFVPTNCNVLIYTIRIQYLHSCVAHNFEHNRLAKALCQHNRSTKILIECGMHVPTIK